MPRQSIMDMSNFTPRAQRVVELAAQEADRLNHPFIGTEHLLLGLLMLDQGVGVNVLRHTGVNLQSVRMKIDELVGPGPGPKMSGKAPYTPRAEKALSMAAEEAKALNHTYVGTEHILLGLLRNNDGITGVALESLNLDIQQTRQEILKELDPNFSR
jgi:ATP-dependent Clp protease ATP-binding subunit ClpC